MRARQFAVVCCVSLLLATPALAQDDANGDLTTKAGSLLSRALVDPAAPMRRDDGTYHVWVYLADRDLTLDELARSLEAAEAALPARTLKRRSKMLVPGTRAVDARDVPLAPRYLEVVAATGARLRQQSRWLNAVSVAADPGQMSTLAHLPFVTRIELVAGFRRPTPPVSADERAASDAARRATAGDRRWSLDYGGSLAGLEQINVPPVHEMDITGQGVIIGMLDSGFKTTHEALVGVSVLARHDFVNGDDVVENEPGDPTNQHDHGTATLSTIMGFRDGALIGPAYGASVILAKTEDVSQEIPIEEDNWVAGLEWVESLGADLVSSSLGYHEWYEFADLDGNTAVTTIAADIAVGRGLIVVNSAGNERGIYNFDHILAPADGDSVIAVAAVTLAGAIASFSSPGPTYDGRIKPDVSAQGVSNHVADVNDDHGYSTADGTSFACPLASGVAALVLARAPELTPLQVREALRETADRASAPDNDYGWGILDALAAATYWGPVLDHTVLGDTEDTLGPYDVTATITDRLPLDPSRAFLFWRANGGAWQQTALVLIGDDQWQATIPGQASGTTLEYYLEVTDTIDITSWLPFSGAASPLAFAVGPDTTPPALVHQPLDDQPLQTWPPVAVARATDNFGIDRVELVFALNGDPAQGPYALTASGDLYSLAFPLDAGSVTAGDQITYTLTAWDLAGTPNSVVSGPHGFAVAGNPGPVLVIDDSGTGLVDEKSSEDRSFLPPREGRSSATEIATWLGAADYTVDVIAASAVGPGSLDGYPAVVYSAGNSTTPLGGQTLRDVLRAWTGGGGRLLVEGGEVGYDALQSPGYPDFARDVLHAEAWRSDNAGALRVVVDQANHPVLTWPHLLQAVIPVSYDGYGDQDAVTPAADALVVMDPVDRPGLAGILVHDDNAAPQAGQVVYLAVNVGAIDPVVGAGLVENAVTYLLAAETPPTASLAGTVSLVGGGDPAGITLSAGPGHDTVTGPDGSYQLLALYDGTYTVTASKAGYATDAQRVRLAYGEALSDVDFALRPVHAVHAAANPELSIPDANPGGITSIVQIADPGELFDLSVDIDIAHTSIGDLTVQLTSPTGTAIILHNRTGAGADDLVGNWPQTLTVDGPGALSDVHGEDVAGAWTLLVSDAFAGQTGVLHAWGLHVLVVDDVTTAAEATPAVTRLVGNWPNPFNPQTTVVFDLARSEPVRLEVFDLRGRLVRRLVDGALAAGRHEVNWDGRDERGRDAASGVYLVRLGGAGIVGTMKAALVR